MQFSWGCPESDKNFRRRGFDFAFASLIFDGPTLEREDRRRGDGELRTIAIGLAEGLELTVCYTARVTAPGEIERRIISARWSNRRERKAYQAALEGS